MVALTCFIVVAHNAYILKRHKRGCICSCADKQQVDRNKKRANDGIAGAMAMSGIVPVPGNDFSLGIATSGYRDQGAIATGIQARISPNANVNIKAAWDSGNGVGVVAGPNIGW